MEGKETHFPPFIQDILSFPPLRYLTLDLLYNLPFSLLLPQGTGMVKSTKNQFYFSMTSRKGLTIKPYQCSKELKEHKTVTCTYQHGLNMHILPHKFFPFLLYHSGICHRNRTKRCTLRDLLQGIGLCNCGADQPSLISVEQAIRKGRPGLQGKAALYRRNFRVFKEVSALLLRPFKLTESAHKDYIEQSL